ncbi:TetR/AcrR family transcriptional regulator [Micrococcus luteus]|uniref:TetR/AcrR family transcriptional regulator n=3 Tax=Micrococcus luteus TaxID=1270 RepID=UPI003879A1A8
MTSPPDTASAALRRDRIADAGIRIIGAQGLRALTHRAVDQEAGLPQGSTSYYARTRAELIALIADALGARAERAIQELSPLDLGRLPERCDEAIGVVAAQVAELAQVMGEDVTALRARYALLLELSPEDPAWSSLRGPARVREVVLTMAEEALGRVGVRDDSGRARELLALVDGLLFRQAVTAGPAPIQPVVETFIRGLPKDGNARP